MKWFIKCLRLYAMFKGRARRSKYGYFLLFNTVFGNMAALLDCLLTRNGRFGWIYTAYALIMLLPSLRSVSGGCTTRVEADGNLCGIILPA